MSTGPSPLFALPTPSEAGPSPAARPPRPASRQWLPLIIVIFLAIVIVVPPLFNIQRYQRRIAENMSRSLGRPVHFSRMQLHLLPRPGFDLSDFTIEEGPGFGAEPILHSASVGASVRLLSLWRGRLEIARIALDEPSLNLVRNAAGQWNFASILTQASQTQVAPTGQAKPSRTLRFPYIEATNARINFKQGDEKQPFSFMNGKLSVWLEHADEWQLRFTAEPVRTDLDLYASNTGLVRIEGSMQRAAMLGSVPLRLRAEWLHAPLGQVDRLFADPVSDGTKEHADQQSGQQSDDPSDWGWRGELALRSRLSGTPTQLAMDSTIEVDDLHRVEFAPEHPLTYTAHCTGSYQKPLEQLQDLACDVPIGDGHIAIAGIVQSQAGGSQALHSWVDLQRKTFPEQASHLDVSLVQVPASSVLDFLRLTREHLGPGLTVEGDLNGRFALGLAQHHTVLSGSMESDPLILRAPNLKQPLTLNGIHLAALGALRSVRSPTGAGAPSLLLAPVKIDFGGVTPVLVDGRFDRAGFLFHVGGRGELAQLLPAARSLGVLAPGIDALQPEGDATLDLQLRGPWLLPIEAGVTGVLGDTAPSSAASIPSGTVTLHNASLATPYLAAPLAIKSAQASLFGTQIAWNSIVAQYGPVHFTGNFRIPRSCVPQDADPSHVLENPAGSACTRQFDINLPSVHLGALPGILVGNDPLMQQLLDRIGDRIGNRADDRTASGWPPLHGTVRAASAILGLLNLEDAVASLDIAGKHARLESLDAKTLDGTLHLSGTLDAGESPVYHIDGQLNQADMAALGEAFHENWGTGSINIAAHLTLGGLTQQALLSSAQGIFHFDWSRGGLHLPATVPAKTSSAGPSLASFAHFEQWTADGQIHENGLTLEQSLLTGADGARALQGSIGFDRHLDLKATAASQGEPDSQAVTLGGTVSSPEITADLPQE